MKTVAVIMGLALFIFGQGAYELGKDLIAPPPPLSLDLKTLEYRGGKVHQHVVPMGAEVIRADWAAMITRDGVFLCSGGGHGPYAGRPVSMTPSEWTGGDCPALRSGDQLTAVWEWRDRHGSVRSVSHSIKVP